MDENKDFVMVTVSGPDQPGITAAFSKILVENHVEVVDIEQASLQDFLGLSFLLDMSGAKQSKDGVLKDLLFEASRLRLNMNFRVFSEKEMKARNNKNLFVLTYFGNTQALAEISRQGAAIDVVLSDYQMPGKNGADLFRELRERKNGVPFVFMTAYADSIPGGRSVCEGGDGFIEKPCSLEQIISCLEAAARKRKNS